MSAAVLTVVMMDRSTLARAAGDPKAFEGKVFTRTKTNVQKELAKAQKDA